MEIYRYGVTCKIFNPRKYSLRLAQVNLLAYVEISLNEANIGRGPPIHRMLI